MLDSEEDVGLEIKKTLCIFAYYEKDESIKKNIQFFLTNGIHEDMDYIIVVNGISNITLPIRSNVRILRRENTGYDFGAYKHALDNTNLDLYSHFIFINSSVRGPFLNQETKTKRWEYHFLDLLKGNIRLVGTTIHTFFHPNYSNGNNIHVQSMVFCIDRNTLLFLRPEIFSDKHLNSENMVEIIVNKEIKMSQMILARGWNISCTAKKYQGHDYRFLQTNIDKIPYYSDPCYVNNYFGGNLDAYEIIFIKTNRDLHLPTQAEQDRQSEEALLASPPPPMAKLIDETGGLDLM